MEYEGIRVRPAFRRVEKVGGELGDFFKTDDREFLMRCQFFEIDDFELEVEVLGELRELGWRFLGGNQLEAKGVSLPSFQGVAEDRDLAGEALQGEEKKEEELHCWGAKV